MHLRRAGLDLKSSNPKEFQKNLVYVRSYRQFCTTFDWRGWCVCVCVVWVWYGVVWCGCWWGAGVVWVWCGCNVGVMSVWCVCVVCLWYVWCVFVFCLVCVWCAWVCVVCVWCVCVCVCVCVEYNKNIDNSPTKRDFSKIIADLNSWDRWLHSDPYFIFFLTKSEKSIYKGDRLVVNHALTEYPRKQNMK